MKTLSRYTLALVVVLSLCLSFDPAIRVAAQISQQQAEQRPAEQKPPEQERAEQIRSAVAAIGSGTDKRVRIELRNGKRLRGYVSYAGTEKFAVTDEKRDETTTVLYADVVKIERRRRSSIGKNLLIVAGVAGALVIIVGIARNGIGDL